MYRINNLYRNVLCMTDEVIFHAPTGHTMEPRLIQPNIIIAEERFIRQALCSPLYEDILDKKNQTVTDGNKDDLQGKIYNETGQQITLKNGMIVNSVDFLPDNYKKLWYQFLWKLCAEAIAFLAVPEAFIQMDAEGIVHKNPQSSPFSDGKVITPSLSSTKWLMDKKLMDRLDPLIEAMQYWICENKSDYPLYCNKCDCDQEDGVSFKRKTSYVFGIYDDDEPKSCCDG